MVLAELTRAMAALGVPRDGTGRLLVACSGGLDSVVLAEAATRVFGAGRVVLGHVDHAVRPGSERDAGFVEAFAADLGVGFVTARLEPGPSDEARLRRLRYGALLAWRAELAADFVLTAHTLDDQAETVLLGLLRSTTLRALRGIPASRGPVARPLLRVPRRLLRRYAERRGLRWRDDPSNLEPRYLRNRIRRELLPLLELRYRPGLRGRLARLAGEVGEHLARSPGTGPVHPFPPRNRVAGVDRERTSSTMGLSPTPQASHATAAPHAEPVVDADLPVGRLLTSCGPGRAGAPGGPRGDPTPSTWSPLASDRQAHHGPAASVGARMAVAVAHRAWRQASASVLTPTPASLPEGRFQAVFDADAVPAPVLRLPRPGDRIRPFGMRGRRRIVEVLREAGVPPRARPSWPVVALEDGEVLWVPGVLRSAWAPVTESTHHVWVMWVVGSELRSDDSRVTLGELTFDGQDGGDAPTCPTSTVGAEPAPRERPSGRAKER